MQEGKSVFLCAGMLAFLVSYLSSDLTGTVSEVAHHSFYYFEKKAKYLSFNKELN